MPGACGYHVMDPVILHRFESRFRLLGIALTHSGQGPDWRVPGVGIQSVNELTLLTQPSARTLEFRVGELPQ